MQKPHQHIVEGCREGKSSSQRAMYEQFAPKMLAVCHRYARRSGDAEDMLQDAFVKVFQNIDRYDDRGQRSLPEYNSGA